MYRRSNSSSNIPLLKTNLFNAKDSKSSKAGRRSQSASRVSQRDSGASHFQHRPQRQSSLDRKSSLLKVTPLHRPGGRSGSLPRTTPTSAISQRVTTSRGTTPLSSGKKHVTIQKLSSDKKWVAEQYAKVQNFIMSSGLFDLKVVNSSNIRPPTINVFTYVTGVMLMELLPKVKINKEDYKEKIPAQLKILRYPGTFTNSTLKTVNTMHSWPQVIGMWSWLADKVTLTRHTGDDLSFVEHLNPEDMTKYSLNQNVEDFMLRRYENFNMNGDDCDEVAKINETYAKKLAELLDTDFDKLRQLEDDLAKKQEYKNKQVQDIEHLRAESKKMESELEKMKKEIADFEENDPILESALENDLQLLQSNLAKQKEALESTKAYISTLREAIKAQPCTYQEKIALLRQIEELKMDIQVKRDKIEHAREIKNKFDYKLTMDISKIQELVIRWNRSLKEVSIKKPHLKKLLLREKGFHDPNFLKELEEVFEYRQIVEKETTEALIKIDDNLRNKEQRNDKVVKEISEIQNAISRIDDDYIVLTEKFNKITLQMENLVQDLDGKKKSHIERLKELQDDDGLDTQMKSIADLKNKKEHLAAEVKKFGPKMLSFLIEMHNQIVTNLKEMEGVRDRVLQKIQAKQTDILEKQRRMIEILESFKH